MRTLYVLFICLLSRNKLTKTSSLTLPLEQAQNISLSNRSLDVTYDGTSSTGSLVLHEFNTDLGYVTGVSGTSEDLIYFSELYWLILCLG